MEVPEKIVEDLLTLGPFGKLDEDGRDMLAFEARLALGSESLPEDVFQRVAYVRFVEHQQGDVLVQEGDLSTEFGVVLEGAVTATYARGGESVEHRTCRRGQWLGASSALSHHPMLATWTAIEDTRVALLDHRLFVRLYDENDDFSALIDARYEDEDRALHLGHSTMFRDLELDDVREVARQATLVRVAPGEVLAEQTKPVEAFYLVRSGALRCTRTLESGETRVLAIYRGNSSFGEQAVTADGQTWPGTITADTRSELLALPRVVLERLPGDLTRSMEAAAVRALREDAGEGEVPGADEVHVMLTRESVKGGQALVIDLVKCVRCNLCVESCVAVHRDGIPRIGKVGTRVATDEVLISACYHCEVPECMLACGYGAIRRDAQGRIRFEFDNCVGCADCIGACPYGVIRLVEPFDPAGVRRETWLDRIPFLGRWLGASAKGTAAAPGASGAQAGSASTSRVVNVGGEEVKVQGKAIKCDLCAALPFEACVYNCPTSAIHRRAPESLFSSGRGAS